jgi:DNA-3-methyladenine glycosylase I
LVFFVFGTDPSYTIFHDEEWGVPVYEDRKLFELLVFSQALAELSWPAILNKRDIFRFFVSTPSTHLSFNREKTKNLMFVFDPFGRKLFDSFDPSAIAQFTEKKLMSLKVNGSPLLSEPKLRAVVENAKQVLKVINKSGQGIIMHLMSHLTFLPT